MMTIAFDGPDGSGKTPCLEVVADLLSSKGLFVHICAPYRAIEVYSLWESDPMSAAISIRRVIDENLASAARDARDVVLFDRHWPTAAVTASDWRAVDHIRQSGLDHLFMLVPSSPVKKLAPARPWMSSGVDRHWTSYRCLVEGAAGIHRPRSDIRGRFDLRAIAEEVAWCCGV